MYETLEGVAGAITYFDDVLVFGKTLEEHNLNLDKTLTKFSESGLTLNLRKAKICQKSIKFLGHVISDHGISPDVSKISAIKNMKIPETKKDLQRFLGMIVYLAKFIPNLSQETSLLRKLLSDKYEWQWTENENACFNRLKGLATSAPVLSYFDPLKEIILSVDASPYGLGAVIIQDNHPIEYALISLTPAQQKYNHIEKELLALVFGCERFHFYLYAKKFVIHSDHRPLLGLLKKPIDDLSPRLQRLAIKLLRYQFKLEYVPGKKMQVADALSRDPNPDTIETSYLDSNLRVYSILATSKGNEQRLLNAINNDVDLQKVVKYILDGWPNHKAAVDPEVRPYWNIHNDLYIHKDVVFYKKRLIIPSELRPEFLRLVHKSHQGVVSCKKLAQDSIYWPGISAAIENDVLSCLICQEYSRSNAREPLMSHDVPKLPWQKIGIDFKSVGPLHFLVIVDYFSKFVVVNKIPNKTGESVISSLKNVFAINGLPQEIMSDNGPPFNSSEFTRFADKYDIQLTTSSPLYSQSNGMVERAIQSVKGLLMKSIKEGEDPFLAVLNHNVTPKADAPAPCDLLMGRKLRTTLPVQQSALQPKYSLKGVRQKLKVSQEKHAQYYNKSAKTLTKLLPQQKVLVQQGSRDWKPSVIVRKSGPNDYLVHCENGAEYRRNRKLLRPLRETSPNASNENTCTNDPQPQPLEDPHTRDSVVSAKSGTVMTDSENDISDTPAVTINS